MAEKNKFQLIYQDLSAVHYGGRPVKDYESVSSSLLGGEIWYN